MVERWFFYQDTAQLWKWARLDVLGCVLAQSGASFQSRDECIEHARANGYAPLASAPHAHSPLPEARARDSHV